MKKLVFFTILFSTPAYGLDVPDIKPGLWKIVTTVEDSTVEMKQCFAKGTFQKILENGQRTFGEQCGENSYEKIEADYKYNIECHILGSKVTAETKVSGNFSKEYISEITVNYDPPYEGMTKSHALSKNIWLGECESGMVEGDTILEDGMKFNALK